AAPAARSPQVSEPRDRRLHALAVGAEIPGDEGAAGLVDDAGDLLVTEGRALRVRLVGLAPPGLQIPGGPPGQEGDHPARGHDGRRSPSTTARARSREETMPVTRPSRTIGMWWMRIPHIMRHSSRTSVSSVAQTAGEVMMSRTRVSVPPPSGRPIV